MFLQSLLVLSQRGARLVSNVRASTRTAHSVTISSVWCGRWASTRDHRAQSLIPYASTRTEQADPSHCCVGVGRARKTNGPNPSSSRAQGLTGLIHPSSTGDKPSRYFSDSFYNEG